MRPLLHFEGCQQRAGRFLVLPPVFQDGHLIVNKGGGFSLNDFQDARVLFVEHENLRGRQMFGGIEVTGRSFFDWRR
jgi:hypothetical protein